MEEHRQNHSQLIAIAPGVFRREKRKMQTSQLLPKLDPKDFPTALPIRRVERLVGRRLKSPDS